MEETGMSHAVVIKKAVKKYGNFTALNGVDLEIKPGEFFTLLGPSGCGKTTLLRIIADLQEPTTGTVRINGMTPREVRLQQKFGIVFRSPVLLDWRTVRKNMN